MPFRNGNPKPNWDRDTNSTWKRDPVFYLCDGDCGVRFGNVIFKVHQVILEKSRLIFQLFQLNQGYDAHSRGSFLTHPPRPERKGEIETDLHGLVSRYRVGVTYLENRYGFPMLVLLCGKDLWDYENELQTGRAGEENECHMAVDDSPIARDGNGDASATVEAEQTEDLEQFRAWLWAAYFRDEFRDELGNPTDMLRLARVALMAQRLDCISWQFTLVPKLIKRTTEPRSQNPDQEAQTNLEQFQQLVAENSSTYISDCSYRFLPYLMDVVLLYQLKDEVRMKIEDKWAARLSFEDEEHMAAIKYAEHRGLKRLISEVLYEFVVRKSSPAQSDESRPRTLAPTPILKEVIPGYMKEVAQGREALKIFWDWVCATLPSMFQGSPHKSCNSIDHRRRCVPAFTRYWISHIDAVQRADEQSLLEKLGHQTSSDQLRQYGKMFDARMKLVKIWASMGAYSTEEERMKHVEYQLKKEKLLWEMQHGCSAQRKKELMEELKIRRVKGARKQCWDLGVEKIVEQFNALHDGWRLETFFFKDLEVTKQVFGIGPCVKTRSVQPAKYRIVDPGEQVQSLMQL
ncbi:hypothetical protein VKT23_008299 [Stygiomarasmius scandens]|uniref:BTB domain-containing protein n=1 Tax=Marasmiellus scandens TaxID=2682957 RepID=A0ABR1JP09_9AGAR